MKKKILFLAGNYYPELTGIGRYNNEMIDWLADNGFACTVISTYPYYPHWEIQEPYKKKGRWFLKETKTTQANNVITVYRCPHYVPATPTGRKRIIFDFSFFMSAALRLTLLAGRKYDFVLNVSPPLPLGLIASLYKRISSAEFLYHIQDLQVDAARDLNIISSKELIKVLFKMERFILTSANRISTISEGMKKKVMVKTSKPVFLFPNWSDTKAFFPLSDKNSLKRVFGLREHVPVVLYSGAIGEKQGLETVLSMAQNFQAGNIPAQFVICGEGHYKTVLERKSRCLKLVNVTFMALQPNEKLNEFLNMADVHLVIQKAGAADLVMPSKLTNILSVGGLGIITANPGSSLYETIFSHKIGLLCPAEDNDALKTAVLYALNEDNSNVWLNARKYAEEYLAIHKIMQRYVTEVMNC